MAKKAKNKHAASAAFFQRVNGPDFDIKRRRNRVAVAVVVKVVLAVTIIPMVIAGLEAMAIADIRLHLLAHRIISCACQAM